MKTEIPVLIAGGGPVGTTLALDLAVRGVASIVVEERLAMPPNPKCNTTNARSMEHYRRLGCADAIRRAGLPLDRSTDVVYVTRWTGHELTRYKLRSSAEVIDKATNTGAIDDYWPTPEPQHRVSQLAMEPAIRDHLKTFSGCDYREGWRFLSFEQADEFVDCIVQEIASGAEHEIRCRYLVSCEGARSVIRRAMDVELEGRDCVAKFCTTYLKSAALKELWPHAPAWMHRIYNADGESHVVAIDGEDRWLHHSILSPDSDLDAHDHRSAIRNAFGVDIDYEVLGQERWIARAMVADRYRKQRVFLCGDAAHIWIPMGGFGMNAGVEDAINLSWKLSANLSGWANSNLLDTYEVERRLIGQLVAGSAAKIFEDLYQIPVQHALHEAEGEHAVEHRAEVGQSITKHNVAEFDSIGMQLGVAYDNSPAIVYDGAITPEFVINKYVESSRPGVRAPHFWRSSGVALYDDLGPEFTLLRIGSNPPDAHALVAGFAAHKVPLKVLSIHEPIAAQKYENYSLVLIRPDQHIAWRARQDPSDVEKIISTVTGANQQ
ncbi:MAG: 2-polyprenyl-6-methoxyphenol hydroxylase-like FAD-dependent oxidoreductase [Gammaproteobacteria bacterium]|jgi:2-polyprenyl-6-methoxyphenol hydroxylase-like FAD-dependent oxidoreductase